MTLAVAGFLNAAGLVLNWDPAIPAIRREPRGNASSGTTPCLDPDRVCLVTPSHWMEQQVGRSPLLRRFPRSVIPYGLDLEVFQPRDRRVAREVLGLPSDAQVLLFNA